MTEDLAGTLNAIVGGWYIVLAVIFAGTIYSVVINLRTIMLPKAAFYWLGGASLGAFAFFAGCGMHHLDLAAHIWNGQAKEQRQTHMIVMSVLQAIGAPLAIGGFWVLLSRMIRLQAISIIWRPGDPERRRTTDRRGAEVGGTA